MKILLCAATEFEIRATTEWIKERKLHQVSILITGVGLVATTYQLTRAVQLERPTMLVQAGIGGAIDKSLQLNDVVAVSSEMIGDLGVTEGTGFRNIFDLGFGDPDQFPMEGGRLHAQVSVLEKSGFRTAAGVSVNEISTRTESIARYAGMGIGVESMEGAAFHYVALMEKIPFLQIRSLSNFAGERDKSRWRLKESIESLNTALRNYLIKEMNL